MGGGGLGNWPSLGRWVPDLGTGCDSRLNTERSPGDGATN